VLRTGLTMGRLKILSTDFIDAAIRAAYQSTPYRGLRQELARRLNRPVWWIGRRAINLGLVTPRHKEPPWSAAELSLLEQHHWKTPEAIAAIFRRRGYPRTPTAIELKRRRYGLRVADAEVYTAAQLALFMGVNGKTVCTWIARGWLKASRKGTARLSCQGGDHHQITQRAVRQFIIDYTAHVDTRKCDRLWLVDTLTQHAGAKGAAFREASDAPAATG
jgi:hypothetical protein